MGELLELEHAWALAMKKPDLPVLEELLAPEYRLTFAADPRAPRAISRGEWFAALEKMSFGEYSFSEVNEVDYGNRGVVHMRARFHDWIFDGTLLPVEYVLTDVFVKRQGRWQVINRISEGVDGSPNF
jgi:hypothetical protein